MYLHPVQLKYAALDVHILFRIYWRWRTTEK